jgi:glycosyltransferase involved in cell wall biosynthesis
MKSPLVTVLIDTYNYGRYVGEAIESVLGQDFSKNDREILVIDDGSTDDTVDQLHQYRESVVYLHKPNGGQASAFNLGLELARGQIICLLDADDYWLPGKLKRVVEEFECNPEAGMVYHGFRQLDSRVGSCRGGGLPLFSGFLPANFHDLLGYILFPTSFLAFRRNALELLLPIPEGLIIQADAHLSALMAFVAPIIGISEELGVYRVHGSNLFSDRSEKNSARQELRIKTRKLLMHGMKRWLTDRGWDLRDADLYAFFKQWDLAQEGDQFTLKTPGRIKISRHLVQYAHYYGPRLSWRHKTVTYLNAAGALVVGYENVHRLDEWREAVKSMFWRETAKFGDDPAHL